MRIDTAAVQTITCRYCGAVRLNPCRTKSGRATRPHSARTEPLYDAWRDGFRDGGRDVAGMARRLITKALAKDTGTPRADVATALDQLDRYSA